MVTITPRISDLTGKLVKAYNTWASAVQFRGDLSNEVATSAIDEIKHYLDELHLEVEKQKPANTFDEMPEAIAAKIVWRLVAHAYSLDHFQKVLTSGMGPCWNQAVAKIADAMREYAKQQVQYEREQFNADLELVDRLHEEAEWLAESEVARSFGCEDDLRKPYEVGL